MRKQKLDPQVEQYLSKLRREAAVLPADRRADLLREIRAHVESALHSGEPPERVVTNLGDPRTVVAEAQSEPMAESQFAAVDVGAILLLALTALFSVFAWFGAAVMGFRSAAWSPKQKLIGVVLWPWATFALLFFASGGPPDGELVGGPVMDFYWLVGRFTTFFWIGAVYLYRVHPARIARQRAKQATGSVLHRALGDSFTLRR